jgi:ABC-type transport system substrate-binding protein
VCYTFLIPSVVGQRLQLIRKGQHGFGSRERRLISRRRTGMLKVGHFQPKFSHILGGVATCILLLAVACGAAAPAPAAQEAPKPPAEKPAAPAAAAPKATTAPTPAPVASAPKVHPGKVTLLVGDFGTERFDTTYGTTGKDIRKTFHGHLTSWDLVDGRMVIVPGIASKWELSNGGKTTTYTIRKGAKFHDGTEITAEDVLWTFQHGMGPQAKEYSKSSPGIQYSGLMDRIELVGPDQVSITTKVASPELAVYISENEGGATQGQVLPKRAKLHDLTDVEAYEKNPIGAGPGKVVKHVKLQSITFERFDDFYFQPALGFATDKRFKFKTLELVQIPEEATRAAAIRAGEGDIAAVSLATRKQIEAGGGRLVFSPESVILESHIWGCHKPQYPCHDKRVRQALNYAVNKELMRDRLFGGPEVMALEGWWIVTPSTIGYSPDLAPWPFDPNKARQLLAEAGYKTPTNSGGKDFGKLVINTYQDLLLPNLIESAQLAADVWRKELGLDVEVKVMDKVVHNETRTLRMEEFDGTINWTAQNSRLDGAGITRLYFLSKYKKEAFTRVHADPELFALTEKTLNSIGQPDEAAVFNSTYRRLREEAYQISIGYLNAPFAVGPRIQSWQPYRVAEYASALHTLTLK